MIFPNNKLTKTLGLIGGAFVLAVLLARAFLFSWYTYSGSLMYPTLHSQKVLFVSFISTPQRGDLVLAQFPNQSKSFFRVIGLPGDSVSYNSNQIILNGQLIASKTSPLAEEIIKNYSGPLYPNTTKDSLSVKRELLGEASYDVLLLNIDKNNYGPVVVPKDAYYLIQDNRIISSDSRYLGIIDKSKVIGKVL